MPLNLRELTSGVHADTLAAVTLGAVVATLSGVLANVIEGRVRARERERAAALLVGEAMASMRALLEGARAAMDVGERWGPVTRRMLITARRELDLYERNRELLLDLSDARLRADLHAVMMRLAMPLDGILDSLADPATTHPDARERGVAFMAQTLTRLPPLLERLSRVAGRDFSFYDEILQPPADALERFATASKSPPEETNPS